MNRKHARKRLHQRLFNKVGRAIQDYDMVRDGDHIMVCLSGGKDSFALLDILCGLQKKAPVSFQITAVHLDQGFPGTSPEPVEQFARHRGVAYHQVSENVYQIVRQTLGDAETRCSLCSRLRRGVLYSTASKLGIHKIALGHHQDDVLETLMLNMFFCGSLKAMPPVLVSENREFLVIRPLYYVRETDLEAYSAMLRYPAVTCAGCEGYGPQQRAAVKEMIRQWEAASPGRADVMAAALRNVQPAFLADPRCFDFLRLRRQARPSNPPQVKQASIPSTRVSEGSALAACAVHRWCEDRVERVQDDLAMERPLTIHCRAVGEPEKHLLTTTLRSPGHDDYLAVGALVAAGWISGTSESAFLRVDLQPDQHADSACVDVPSLRLPRARAEWVFASGARVMTDASEHTQKEVSRSEPGELQPWSARMLRALPVRLTAGQTGYRRSGALHACALVDVQGECEALFEDIGRHNALDKLIGFATLTRILPCRNHLLWVSGRVGYELILKALKLGVAVMAAQGAPTHQATQWAQKNNLTLVGFLKADSFNVYSHPQRIEP